MLVKLETDLEMCIELTKYLVEAYTWQISPELEQSIICYMNKPLHLVSRSSVLIV